MEGFSDYHYGKTFTERNELISDEVNSIHLIFNNKNKLYKSTLETLRIENSIL